MDLLAQFLGLFLHLDTSLSAVIQAAGLWTYAILFLVIFCETGLVVTPFLPGGSLLFAAGAFAAKGDLHVLLLLLLLSIAAIVGDTVNYGMGAWIGPRVFREDVRFLKREHLERTRQFYERHGGKTIVLARFIPIIRTFAPFVAGVGAMHYGRFLVYNVCGGILWVALFTLGGYFFGTIPVIEAHFELVIFAIIAVSVLPMVVEMLRPKRTS